MRARTKVVWSVVVVILVAAIAAGVWYLHDQDVKKKNDPLNNVAKVGNAYLKKGDLDALLSSAPSRDAALNCLMEETLYKQIADANKVDISDDAIQAEYGLLGYTAAKVSPYQSACAVATAEMNLDTAAFAGYRTGKVVLVHFDRNLPSYYAVGRPTDAAGLTSDTAYAKNLTTRLYNAVKSGSMTMDQAIATEQADATVGNDAYPTSPHSGAFDTSVASPEGTTLVAEQQAPLPTEIAKLNVGQITPVLSLLEGATPHNEVRRPIMYAFAQVLSVKQPLTGTFDDAVTKQKKLGYEVLTK